MAAERFDTETNDDLTALIAETVDALLAVDKETKAGLSKQLKQLEAQEERLIDLASTGTFSIPRLRAKLKETARKEGVIQEKLARTADRLSYGGETAPAYLQLLRNPGELYRTRRCTPRSD